MGCFCFGSSKHDGRRRSKRTHVSPSSHHHHHQEIQELALRSLVLAEPTEKADSTLHTELTTASSVKEKLPGKQQELNAEEKKRKKVAFDLNVETRDLPSEVVVVLDDYPGRDSLDDEVAEEDKTGKKVTLNSKNSSAVSASSHNLNHRYQNCVRRDDEMDENDEGGEIMRIDLPRQDNSTEQESSESLFSLSIDSRKHVSAAEAGEKEVTSPMLMKSSEEKEFGSSKDSTLNQTPKIRSQYVHSELNPVENSTQWGKAVKARTTSLLEDQEKENVKLDQDSIFSPSKPTPKEIAVDTSLSSWLNESETTPRSNSSGQSVGNSPVKRFNKLSEDRRPILGVLCLEDLGKLSESNTPIIGTVGSYWIRTGQGVDRDFGTSCRGMKSSRSSEEEQRTNLQSISTRLETL